MGQASRADVRRVRNNGTGRWPVHRLWASATVRVVEPANRLSRETCQPAPNVGTAGGSSVTSATPKRSQGAIPVSLEAVSSRKWSADAVMTLEGQLAEVEQRITDAEKDLAAARATAQAEVARRVLGDESDGDALATARATVAWMLDELEQLENTRELLLYRIAQRERTAA